jgi:ABC-2 type transport system permease protein
MMDEHAEAHGVWGSLVVARTTARRAVRSATVWGLAFGVLIYTEISGYGTSFPTRESRESFAETFGANPGLSAVTGPGRQLDTLEGFVAWRTFGLVMVLGAVWGLLTASRLLRGEEDAGRWEVLLSGRTTRRQAAVHALGGLAVGWVVLWVIVSAFTILGGVTSDPGLSASGATYYATAITTSAGIFLAIGALASQLGRTRRQASGLGAAVLATAYLVRLVADAVSGLAWLRWASPLGWIENLEPLTGSRLTPFVPIVALVALGLTSSVLLADRRDVGVGALPPRRAAVPSTALLGSATALTLRLERWVALAWIGGVATLALVFGIVARTAASAEMDDAAVAETVARLGGEGEAVVTWIGYELVYIAALIALAAAGQVSAMRAEEAEGHLDNLLARPLDRRAWLLGRLGVAMVFVLALGVAAGVGAWAGLGPGSGELALGRMLEAGFNAAVPGLLVLGLGTLVVGLVPRFASPLVYGVVLWSFIVFVVGPTMSAPQWFLDTSILVHLGPVPASNLEWITVLSFLMLAGLSVVGGQIAFDRRDLAEA